MKDDHRMRRCKARGEDDRVRCISEEGDEPAIVPSLNSIRVVGAKSRMEPIDQERDNPDAEELERSGSTSF